METADPDSPADRPRATVEDWRRLAYSIRDLDDPAVMARAWDWHDAGKCRPAQTGVDGSFSGSDVYSRWGKHVGQIRGDTVFDTDGRYAGTIVADRVVYRSTR